MRNGLVRHPLREVSLWWRVRRAWSRQGCRRDRAVIVEFGNVAPTPGAGWAISGWWLDMGYCTPPICGITFAPDRSPLIGGYSLTELSALPRH